MHAFPLSILLGLSILSTSCAHAMGPPRPASPDVQTVAHVDLNRYLGRWYEIASIPQWFEKRCTGVQATYSLLEDGRIRVLNECRLDSLNGKLQSASGKARIVDTETNAKLKVTFFWPFSGDYWILDLGTDYDFAAVGSPDHETLWILSRTTTLPETTYQEILERLTKQGFDVSRLVKMIQP
jgi:apolipoprotein D and lipocalin family protein